MKRRKTKTPSGKPRQKKNADRPRHVSARELIRAKEALERKTEELALSLSMMQATLDSTTDAIVVTDMTGNVRNFNEKYCEMMGVTRKQLKKADVNKLRLKFSQRFKDPEGFVSRVMEIYRTAPAETFEVLECKDRTILERYSQVQLLNQKPVGRVWSFRNITERKPLTPAMVAASYLAEHDNLAPEFREQVMAILRNIRLEAQLIDDLLDVTRITRGKIEVQHEGVDVHRLLHSAVEIVRNDIEKKGIELATELNAAQHNIWADPVRIQQVFWNLINNAVKFTPPEGRIIVRSFNRGKQFIFEISDTGIGIEPERQASIFEPFHQGERSITRQFGGLGLGLTISKTLLDLHGGTIEVESVGKNQGTIFRVALDLLSGPVTAAADEDGDGVGTPRSLRLLLVDDHADTRGVLSRLLSKCGHEVVTAESADKALEILDRGRFDALISDIGLPGRSGYELIREAKRRQRLKGIALSGLGMDEDVLRSMEAGFDSHLTKPINFQELNSLLQRLA